MKSDTSCVQHLILISLITQKNFEHEKLLQGRAEGVRSIEQLLEAPLAKVTIACDELGIKPGTIGKDALVLMAKSVEK